MLAHVGNLHTEMACPLVDDEGSALEHCQSLRILVIEVLESDEVAQKPSEIAEDMEEFVHGLDVLSLFLECRIPCNKFKQSRFLVLRQQFVHFFNPERFNLHSGLGCLPCRVGCKRGSDFIPVLFGDDFLVRRNCNAAQGFELCCPNGVDSAAQVDFRLAVDVGERV